MKHLIRITIGVALLAAVAIVFIACDENSTEQAQRSPAQSSTSTEGPPEPLPAGLILAKAPDAPQDVVAVQKSAKAGDTVTLRGRVGGNEKPLADNRAIVTLVDPSVTTCEKMPGDACPTPWDACCDPDAAKKSATIQVVGADGRPLQSTLAGIGGIAPLKELIVTGKVRTPADSGALVVDATGIHVKG